MEQGDCQTTLDKTDVYTTGSRHLSEGKVEFMKEVLQSDTMAVAIDASYSGFALYKSGVFTDVDCPTDLNHAVAIVGWGNDGTYDYWILRNSWGSTWGDNGYMYIEIVDGEGLCGI